MKRVLIVGQDEDEVSYLAGALGSSEFVCSCGRASDVGDDLVLTQADIVLIDAHMVDDEVLASCRRLRSVVNIPLVLCSMSRKESDVIRGFDAGVDDYLVLPMRPAEISARIAALLRRSSRTDSQDVAESLVRAGDLEIDLENNCVTRGGEVIALSPTELRLLATLIRGNGRAVSHAKLIVAVWGPEYVDSRNYLRLYIKYLRSKLEADPRRPRLILNEWGAGYRFNLEASQ